jgi:hypothetical protein
MSKLEVREIGPISGESEVRLADGATAVGFGGGKVLQVVQAEKTDVFSSSGKTFVDVTGLSLNITPSSTSSKIIILASINVSSNMRYSAFRLFRNSTNINIGDPSGIGDRFLITSPIEGNDDISHNNYYLRNSSISYLDSPSTMSPINYKIQTGSTVPNEDSYIYINRTVMDDDIGYCARASSNIIAMEVSG